ncbi:hypothetical protein [Roseinatronobacter alkalisoli]|uniref:Lipoprotein n=1 Tax=Roseinatronobacter alkalisoli TaxID=3028235 RepID=A0ABT5T5J0_9RHOB|nr:hypothetical protein [Roseinatronobacter sp. HJB301]MDD7969497.1 hypothetical protein [Roseinatronobacter sp. HJB301]
MPVNVMPLGRRQGAIPAAFLVFAFLFLTACGGQQIWASDEAVAAARHVHGGAPELTLVTIMHHQSGNGHHTALFINGAERVLFDPAGSWHLDAAPERNDVHYGMTPAVGASFFLSHVRESHYAVVQRLRVTPDVAAQAMALVQQAGPVGSARCAISTSGILQQLPGLEGISRNWHPHRLMQDFAQLPGVTTVELHHNDPDVLRKAYAVQQPL